MALVSIYPATVRIDVSELLALSDDLRRDFEETGDYESLGASKALYALTRAPRTLEEFISTCNIVDKK